MNPRSLLPILVLTGGIVAALLLVRPGGDDPSASTGVTAEAEPAAAPEFPPIPRPDDRESVDPSSLSPSQADLRARLLDVSRQSVQHEDTEKEVRLLNARQDALQELLDTLGPEDLAILVELLLEEPDYMIRRQLIDAIARLRTPAAVDALIDHYWRLYDREKEPELNYAIKALGTVDTPHSFNRLDEMIDHELAEPHRFRFVEQLGRHSEARRAVPRFLEVARPDLQPYFKVRSRAALALKWAGDVGAAPKIEKLLDQEENRYVRQALVGTLGGLGDVGSINKLERIALNDEDFQTRTSAIRALSRIKTDRARGIVERVSVQDENEKVREHALGLLERW